MKRIGIFLATIKLLGVLTVSALAQPGFVNSLTIEGNQVDLSQLGPGANRDRFGHFSDLYYHAQENMWYALSDRGPGGGVIDYQPRLSKFSLDVDPQTGAISRFQLKETILFKLSDTTTPFSGLSPSKDSQRTGGANDRVIGRSFDPEGLVVDAAGNLYVGDEYGPNVYKFDPQGVLKATFLPPDNLVPRDTKGDVTYSGKRKKKSATRLATGRQDNRGFEGLAISPAEDKLYAILQDPLAEEGEQNNGRHGRYLRIVEFDVATQTAKRQFLYALEEIAEINSRIPGKQNDFKAGAQGRNIGVSAIVAFSATEFLVLERDNRGVGIDDPTGTLPVGSKRIYKIDIAKATDVSRISLAGTNSHPSDVTPVAKELFLDLQDELTRNGQPIYDKFEALAMGPSLSDGETAIVVGTDNDYSVTQTESDIQFEVYTNTQGKVRYTAINDQTHSYRTLKEAEVQANSQGPLSGDYKLLPGYLTSFRISSPRSR